MSSLLNEPTFKTVSIVLSVTGVSFLNSFFSGALTASLPTIQKELGISSANLQWSVSLYSLVLGSFLLPMGRLADIWSHKLLFLLGTILFSGVSIAIALSPSWEYFTVFSAILGSGAAANTPAGLGILGNYFLAGAAKNRAFASLGAGQPLGFIGGLVIGALLTETKLSWRGSFYIQAGLALSLAILGYFSIPSAFTSTPTSLADLGVSDASVETIINEHVVEQEDNKKMDWIGALLSISGLVIFTFALADAQATPEGWKTSYIPPLIPLSIFLLVSFYFWELRLYRLTLEYYSKSIGDRIAHGTIPPPPLLSPEILKSPHLIEILAIVFMGWSGFNTLSYYLNLILQLVLKASPIKTALYFLPMIISGTAYNIIPGLLLGRVNAKSLVILSMLLSLIGPICMSFMTVNGSYWQYIFPAMVFLPSVDILYAVATVQISRSVSRSQQATAGALFGVTTRLATATSLSFTSTFSLQASTSYLDNNPLNFGNSQTNTAETPEVLMAGYKVAAYMCLGFLALGAILSIVLLKGIGIIGKHDEEVVEGTELNSLGDQRLTRRRATRIEAEDSGS